MAFLRFFFSVDKHTFINLSKSARDPVFNPGAEIVDVDVGSAQELLSLRCFMKMDLVLPLIQSMTCEVDSLKKKCW